MGNVNESTESGDMAETAHTAPDALRIFSVRKKSRREILMNLVNERVAVISPIALL